MRGKDSRRESGGGASATTDAEGSAEGSTAIVPVGPAGSKVPVAAPASDALPEVGSVVWAREGDSKAADDASVPMWPAYVADSRPGKKISVLWLGYESDPPLGICDIKQVCPFVGESAAEKQRAKECREHADNLLKQKKFALGAELKKALEEADKRAAGEVTGLPANLTNNLVCHKCGRGGSLLLCDGCILSFHKKCLGTGLRVPSGSFLCPFCKEKNAEPRLLTAGPSDEAAGSAAKGKRGRPSGASAPEGKRLKKGERFELVRDGTVVVQGVSPVNALRHAIEKVIRPTEEDCRKLISHSILKSEFIKELRNPSAQEAVIKVEGNAWGFTDAVKGEKYENAQVALKTICTILGLEPELLQIRRMSEAADGREEASSSSAPKSPGGRGGKAARGARGGRGRGRGGAAGRASASAASKATDDDTESDDEAAAAPPPKSPARAGRGRGRGRGRGAISARGSPAARGRAVASPAAGSRGPTPARASGSTPSKAGKRARASGTEDDAEEQAPSAPPPAHDGGESRPFAAIPREEIEGEEEFAKREMEDGGYTAVARGDWGRTPVVLKTFGYAADPSSASHRRYLEELRKTRIEGPGIARVFGVLREGKEGEDAEAAGPATPRGRGRGRGGKAGRGRGGGRGGAGAGLRTAVIVSEGLAGTLAGEQQGTRAPRENLEAACQLARGLRCLHETHGQAHGALDPSAVLVQFAPPVKARLRLRSGPPSPLYTAPEILRKESGPTREADIFSLGMVLYALFTSDEPWKECKGKPEDEARKFLLDKGDARPPLKFKGPRSHGLPEAVADLINRCWAPAPKDRPTARFVHEKLHTLVAEKPKGGGEPKDK